MASNSFDSMLSAMLTASELAVLIGKNERTLANWRCARSGPRFVKLGNSVRYLVAEVEEWIKSRRVETTP
jgi:predicted DNA-binding transcriptional regulator AlpA